MKSRHKEPDVGIKYENCTKPENSTGAENCPKPVNSTEAENCPKPVNSTEAENCTLSDNCCVEEVGDMVRKLVRMFQLFERDQIKIHGFTTTQCYALIEIDKQGSISMNELSDRMNLTSSTMTRILDNMVRDGYVERNKSSEDRRLVLVNLTNLGRDNVVKLNASVNDYYKKVVENIPEGKLDEVLKSADILVKAFEKSNPNCC